MKPVVNKLLSGLALVGLAWQAGAITSDVGSNPYQAVVERNTFGLKPALRPEDVKPPEVAPPPNQIKLQGFYELFGKRRVLLKVTEPPKPGTPPKEEAMTLDEGERRGVIEILAIYVKARTVNLTNAGHVTNRALVYFSATTAARGAGPGGPGPPLAPGLPRPQIGVPRIPTPLPPPAASSYGGMPSRPVRTTPQLGNMSRGGFPTGTPGVATQQPQVQQTQPQLTLEEQSVVMEVERLRTQEAVARGDLPPLPPTDLTPPGAPGSVPSQAPPMPGS